MKRYLALVALAIAMVAVSFFGLRNHDGGVEPDPGGQPPFHAPGPMGTAQRTLPTSPAADAPSHLADGLNSPTADIHSDLRLLDEILRQYRSTLHVENPIGDNSDITAALTGKNRLDFAFIPPGHPAINARGELCDRWGTPYFFHQLSGTQMEIRSAGPDRKLWTADDEVLTPGLYPPRL